MSLPHGPSQSPIEQTFHWFSRPYAFLDECSAQFGETFCLNFQGLGPHVVTSDPEFIRAIFQGDATQFLGGQGKEMLRPFLGENSILLTDGPLYQKHRKGMLPLFRPPWLELWRDSLNEVTAEWLRACRKENLVHEFCLEISLHLIVRAIFGKASAATAISEVVLAFMTGVNFNAQAALDEGGGGKAMERLHRNLNRLDTVVAAEIARQKNNPDEEALLFGLVKTAESEAWNEKEIRDQVVTLLIAGHETTATTLAWTLFEIAKSPSTKKRMEASCDVAFFDSVIKEGMRLWPVIPVVARKLDSVFSFGEWTFEKGVHLVPCVYLAHRRSSAFKNPTQFLPDRFLTLDPSPFEYLPFGGGVRRCLGMGMAMEEMNAVLRQLFQHYQIEFSGMEKVRPARRSVAIIPSGPFRLKLL